MAAASGSICRRAMVAIPATLGSGSFRAFARAGTACFAPAPTWPSARHAVSRTLAAGSFRALVNVGTTNSGSECRRPSELTMSWRTRGFVFAKPFTKMAASAALPWAIFGRPRWGSGGANRRGGPTADGLRAHSAWREIGRAPSECQPCLTGNDLPRQETIKHRSQGEGVGPRLRSFVCPGTLGRPAPKPYYFQSMTAYSARMDRRTTVGLSGSKAGVG